MCLIIQLELQSMQCKLSVHMDPESSEKVTFYRLEVSCPKGIDCIRKIVLIIIFIYLVALLRDTLKKNMEEDPSVIVYWDDDHQCRNANRNTRDNVSNVFLPQLMEVKKSMIKLKKTDDDGDEEFERQVNWIQARLCGGEDEQTDELKKILEDDKTMSSTSHKNAIQIRGQVENIVLALHRVQDMKSRMPDMFSAVLEQV